ncbi:Peptidase propeptide domain-containing protein [Methylophaga frappieri]|uniref:Peptidase propeptide domain-containing protein n=1 Tax=Methylophaga frappieri (strain ATCC BAA-2434 / DSM 25690 / JAM7) TaxID=754477 RepID=I1YJW1_METFJ|nr:PepSY domain-containing protein [Methylophaga frappieri]AFJ03204.1 Peptidase propeptide domain-containing protein [Methylophaga frappieri]
MKTVNKITLAGLISLGLFSVAHADDDHREMQQKIDQFDLISTEEAVKIAQDNKAGVVDDIDLEGNGQGYQYEIEIADSQGAEWDIYIDAKSGEIIKVKQDY